MSARTGWTRVAFGDVVRLARERTSDPEGEGFERYVGLEHIDPGDLRIRRWGNVSDGTTFTNVFRAGQVLFGKRRAYQRKVAVADFDGICSGDIYVFEPKSDALLPELLPFICQTDRFLEHAVGTSAGSLSPRTNWNSLAEFEFPLPPTDEQRRMVVSLKAVDGCLDGLTALSARLYALKRTVELELLSGPLGLRKGVLDLRSAKPSIGWFVWRGSDLLDKGYLTALQDGNHGSQYPRAEELGTEGLPYIAASDISDDGDIDLSACKRLRPERAARLRIPPAKSGDVVLTNNATVGRVTRLPGWPTEIVASTSTTYYRCNEALLNPEYLRWFLESAIFQFQLGTIMRQSTRNQVPITTQKGLLFAIPPPEAQEMLAAQRTRFLDARLGISSRHTQGTQLRTQLLGQLLV